MPKFIRLKSTEAVVDQIGFTRVDAQAILAVDQLSDGSQAYNVYTRLGDQVYEDTHAVDLDEAVDTFKKVCGSLYSLQEALRFQALEGPSQAGGIEPMPEVRDLGGRLFPGHFRWYVMVSNDILDGFPVAGFLTFMDAADMAAELSELDDEAKDRDCHYVVQV